MAEEYERLVGIVLTEAVDRKVAFSLEDLTSALQLSGEKRLDQIKSAVDQLCMIGMLTHQGDKWIHSDYSQQNIVSLNSEEALSGAGPMFLEDASKTRSASSTAVAVPVPIQVTTASGRLETVSYDCDEETIENIEEILRKIFTTLKSSKLPLKAVDVARQSGIGGAKSDVNRYLYALEKKGHLLKKDNKWSLQRNMIDSDLPVYAAEMARVKPSKKHKAKTGQSAGCEYHDEKSNVNCFHMKQENHYHHTVIQVGDGNKAEFHSQGNRAEDEQECLNNGANYKKKQ